MFENLTYEQFKGNSTSIKNKIKTELLSSGKYNPKNKRLSTSKTFSDSTARSKDEFLHIINESFDQAQKKLDTQELKIKLEATYYSTKFVFSGNRPETQKEIETRLNKAVTTKYNVIAKRFASQLRKEAAAKRKEAEVQRKEAARKKDQIKRAKQLIKELGEDVYEVFGELIKN